MVYKGAKYIRFIATMKVNSTGYANTYGVSLTARQADKAGYGATMQAKAAVLNGRSAYSVGAQAAALTNQSGGNIGFTYE
jgi:hypothetical protein